MSESELLIAPPPEEGCPAAPQPACRALATPGGSKIDLKPRKGKLTWKWKSGSATDKSDFGDPAADQAPTDYYLCVYDEDGGEPSLVAAFDVPGGEGWKDQKKGFKLKRRGAGIGKLILKSGEEGKARIPNVKGKELAIPQLPLNQDPRVVVQLIHDEGGCWETVHSAPAQKNDAEKGFRDKAD